MRGFQTTATLMRQALSIGATNVDDSEGEPAPPASVGIRAEGLKRAHGPIMHCEKRRRSHEGWRRAHGALRYWPMRQGVHQICVWGDPGGGGAIVAINLLDVAARYRDAVSVGSYSAEVAQEETHSLFRD